MPHIADEMAKTLSRLIKYPSVQGEPCAGAPFGKEVGECLGDFLRTAESFGLETENFEGYCGQAIFRGAHDTPSDDFAVLCHLDVVPAGGGWTYPPFGGVIDGLKGRVYGRGAVDDKGPAVACLYALREMKREGFKPRRTIKLILGCNEESGWGCIEHYKKRAALPREGFSPDADFPVIYAEKGIMHVRLRFPAPKGVAITGGSAANMVPDRCVAEAELSAEDIQRLADFGLTYEDGKVVSRGKSAHGSTPDRGKNAIAPVLAFFGLGRVYGLLFGGGLGLDGEDESGKLTFSPNVISREGDSIYVVCDVRYPVFHDRKKIFECFERNGVPYEILHEQKPLFSDKNSRLVQILSESYAQVTGVRRPPAAIGGGTYARALERGVAFGPVDEGDEDVVHGADEYISLEKLEKCFKIYKLALERLTK